ncbi:MAG: nucleoside hydrolase [Pseudomonadota bacterium]
MQDNRKKIIVDTDPGIDDAIALCYAMTHPRLEVMALTTVFGNVDTPLATDNAARLCQLTGTQIPVATGATAPLSIAANPHSYFVHGDNGFGNIELPLDNYQPSAKDAADTIIELVMTNPGQITLVAVGPLTNLALALQREPDIIRHVESVVVMGGVFDKRGNVTPFAEANAWNDPHAAKAVLCADWPLVILGLDVTHQVSFDREFFNTLADGNKTVGGFLRDAAQYYIDFYEQRSNFIGCCPHDQLALTYVTNPQWFDCESAALDVIVEGEQIGKTFRTELTTGQRTQRIGKHVNVERLRQDYLSTLTS